MAHGDSSEQKTLPKSLGLFRMTVYGAGTIIESGIYAVISPAAASAGPGIWISLLIAAAISALTAFSYAERTSALPSAGAEHNFLKSALPRWPAATFLVGLFIVIHGAASVPAVALTFSSYLTQIFSMSEKAVALTLVVGLHFQMSMDSNMRVFRSYPASAWSLRLHSRQDIDTQFI